MANLEASMHRDELGGLIIYAFIPKTTIEYEEATTIYQGNWRTPILNYINHGHIPEDKAQARKIRAQATKFCIIGCILFKWSISGHFLNCISTSEAVLVLKELHKGLAGNHSRGRSLAFRAHTAVILLVYHENKRAELVKKCDKC